LDKVTPQTTDNDGIKRTGAHTTSGFGISDKELAKQDNVQRKLTLVFDWIVANKVLIVLLVGVIAFSGIGYVIYTQVKQSTQLKIQDEYFVIEKDYLKIKTDFDEADRQAIAAEAKAKDKTKKDAKKDEPKEEPPKARASGDLDKDYGTVVARLTHLHGANPKSNPGKVASLLLADLYWEYKKFDAAAGVLEKSLESKPTDLVDFLILKKMSSTQLSMGQFDQVVKKNQSVVSSNKYPFLTSYYKIQMGLAYEGLKQWDAAEAQYKDVIAKGEAPKPELPNDEKLKRHFGSDQSAAEQAQKYLLLLRLKKSEAQAGA
jgi:tetratricopeptide (TPR) repeat protein